jgi:hypothetical protein
MNILEAKFMIFDTINKLRAINTNINYHLTNR